MSASDEETEAAHDADGVPAGPGRVGPRGGGASQRPELHDDRESAAHVRDDAAGLRDDAAVLRDDAAVLRDGAADLRGRSGDPESAQSDRTVDRRDRNADRRDRAAERRDLVAAQTETGVATASSDDQGGTARELAAADRRDAGRDRVASAEERTAASEDRAASSADREASSEDRTLSAEDREASYDDRAVLAGSLRESSLDGLTGAYLRGAGRAELRRDLLRAKRDRQPFTVAFVDVDGLKGVNDVQGHAAGDRLLHQVVETLKESMRPYDLVIRWGGDEFVCALVGMTRTDVAVRMADINGTLASRSEGLASVTVGLAEFKQDDSVESLVARADTQLYEKRRQRATSK